MTMNDPVFGTLEPDPNLPHLFWRGNAVLPLLGETTILLSMVDDSITTLQREAYVNFTHNIENFVANAMRRVYNLYSSHQYFLNKVSFIDTLKYDPLGLLSHMKEPHICVSSKHGSMGVLIGLAFARVEFEREQGVGVSFVGNEVFDVGDAGYGMIP